MNILSQQSWFTRCPPDNRWLSYSHYDGRSNFCIYHLPKTGITITGQSSGIGYSLQAADAARIWFDTKFHPLPAKFYKQSLGRVVRYSDLVLREKINKKLCQKLEILDET